MPVLLDLSLGRQFQSYSHNRNYYHNNMTLHYRRFMISCTEWMENQDQDQDWDQVVVYLKWMGMVASQQVLVMILVVVEF